MQARYTLGQHENKLCVIYTVSDYFNPQIHNHYWPIGNRCFSDWKEYIGRELRNTTDWRAIYEFKTTEPGSWLRSIGFQLLNGGQTKPIHTVIEPYQCPKVRRGIETRYRNGQWEKHLKTGWEVIY